MVKICYIFRKRQEEKNPKYTDTLIKEKKLKQRSKSVRGNVQKQIKGKNSRKFFKNVKVTKIKIV